MSSSQTQLSRRFRVHIRDQLYDESGASPEGLAIYALSDPRDISNVRADRDDIQADHKDITADRADVRADRQDVRDDQARWEDDNIHDIQRVHKNVQSAGNVQADRDRDVQADRTDMRSDLKRYPSGSPGRAGGPEGYSARPDGPARRPEGSAPRLCRAANAHLIRPGILGNALLEKASPIRALLGEVVMHGWSRA